MSSNPGSTFPVDPTLGTPLEQSLQHIVDNSFPDGEQADQGDELARGC